MKKPMALVLVFLLVLSSFYPLPMLAQLQRRTFSPTEPIAWWEAFEPCGLIATVPLPNAMVPQSIRIILSRGMREGSFPIRWRIAVNIPDVLARLIRNVVLELNEELGFLAFEIGEPFEYQEEYERDLQNGSIHVKTYESLLGLLQYTPNENVIHWIEASSFALPYALFAHPQVYKPKLAAVYRNPFYVARDSVHKLGTTKIHGIFDSSREGAAPIYPLTLKDTYILIPGVDVILNARIFETSIQSPQEIADKFANRIPDWMANLNLVNPLDVPEGANGLPSFEQLRSFFSDVEDYILQTSDEEIQSIAEANRMSLLEQVPHIQPNYVRELSLNSTEDARFVLGALASDQRNFWYKEFFFQKETQPEKAQVFFQNVVKHEMLHALGLNDIPRHVIEATEAHLGLNPGEVISPFPEPSNMESFPIMSYIDKLIDLDNPGSYYDQTAPLGPEVFYALSCAYDIEALRRDYPLPLR